MCFRLKLQMVSSKAVTDFFQFMKTPKRQKRKGVTAEEHEEHVISILVSGLILRFLTTFNKLLLPPSGQSDNQNYFVAKLL